MAPNAQASIFGDMRDVLNDKKDQSEQNSVAFLLDSKGDTDGLSKMNDDTEDWTDVKHSERKKRDRILDDGVLLQLMKKSDFEGFKRLFTNLGIMAATAYAIYRLDVFALRGESLDLEKLGVFLPLYLFYGFQFQCFAFAGQHEFLHRNAFKTKWINDWVLFVVGTVCFEFGKHERVMHKQHHTFTNNIDKDPELTSYFTRAQLEDPGFRNVPSSRSDYFRGFCDVFFTFRCRVCRLLWSSCGIPVDYSGVKWTMGTNTYTKESGIMQDLQRAAQAQMLIYVAVFCTIGQTVEGRQALLFWWIVPVIIGYPAVNYVRNLEHADCEVSKQPNCLKNTRTVRSNAFIRLLLWNTNFHAEHHCYPMVPFFNLPKVNALMHDYVEHNEATHFTTQNWECLKGGGWIDQQSNRINSRKAD